MKYKGSSILPPKPLDIIIPRQGGNIHLKAQAVLDFEPFDKAIQQPVPPMVRKVGQEAKSDFKDKGYLKEWDAWWDKREGWTVIKSLSATEDLEFDSMKSEDPSTCSLKAVIQEFKASGFLGSEISYILKQVRIANAMDENHLEEARKLFLLQQAEPSE